MTFERASVYYDHNTGEFIEKSKLTKKNHVIIKRETTKTPTNTGILITDNYGIKTRKEDATEQQLF